MELSFDELNNQRFRWDDELHADPKQFLSEELHSAKKRADGKGYDFGLDDEIRTDFEELDEQVVLERIEEYFEPMGISREQKNFRVKKAKECYDDFLFMLYWIDTLREHNETVNWESILSITVKRLLSTFSESNEESIKDIVTSDVVDAIDVTERHIEDPTFLAPDRALNLGIAVAGDVANLIDFEEAVKNKKTKKTWHTILDGRERESHRVLAGRTIPIDDLFLVGDSLMKFPRDMDYDPALSEVCNCRCWCIYR